jgi:hypothetical protein
MPTIGEGKNLNFAQYSLKVEDSPLIKSSTNMITNVEIKKIVKSPNINYKILLTELFYPS